MPAVPWGLPAANSCRYYWVAWSLGFSFQVPEKYSVFFSEGVLSCLPIDRAIPPFVAEGAACSRQFCGTLRENRKFHITCRMKSIACSTISSYLVFILLLQSSVILAAHCNAWIYSVTWINTREGRSQWQSDLHPHRLFIPWWFRVKLANLS